LIPRNGEARDGGSVEVVRRDEKRSAPPSNKYIIFLSI